MMATSIRRFRTIASGLLVTALAVLLVIVAVRADGRPASQGETNDGGAWLMDRQAGAIGHVNRSSREVSGAVRVATPGTVFSTEQAPGVVLVHDQSRQEVTFVDDRVYAPTVTVPLGIDADVHAMDGGVTVVRKNPLAVWSTDTTTLTGGVEESIDELSPVVSSTGAGVVVTTRDDTIVVADAAGTVTWWSGGDQGTAAVDVGPPTGLTTIGDMAVVAGAEGDVAVTRAGQPATTWSAPDIATWQQPGPTAEAVVGVTGDGVVRHVDLEDGDADELVELGGSNPVAPIVHGGCVFALAQQPAVFARVCGDQQDVVPLQGHVGGELRLRLVNGWVWINAIEDGTAWVAGIEGDLEEADDVGEALTDDDGDGDEGSATGDSSEQVADNESDTVGTADELGELGANEPPVANPDEQVSRADRAMIVDVLANDTDPNGDVLMVESVANVPSDAVVSITGDQRFVQVVPGPGYTGAISFDYTITDGRGGQATSTVTAEFIPSDAANRPPIAETDFAAVAPGTPASLNLLDNDHDPDGDVISMTGIAGEGVAKPVWQPDGEVTVTPDLTASGQLELAYTIIDASGEPAEGRLRLDVRDVEFDNRPPDARHDWGVTTVDTATTFNVLDNDQDPDGDLLVVSSATPDPVSVPDGAEAARATVSPDGAFLLDPPEAGSYVYRYTVSDGGYTDTALVRVEVTDPDDNRPPVAVADTAVIPRGSSRVVPVLRNDADPDGDVVGIVDWTGGTDLQVEPVPGVGFRVTVAGDAGTQDNFRYRISDGVNEPVEAPVYVLVSDQGGRDQLPVARPDQAEARPGQPVAVPVLRNDHDPEGGPLKVVHVPEREDAELDIGAAGQRVIVTLPDDATSGVTFPYEVEDVAGNRASSTVEVLVVPPGQDNRPPVAVPDVAVTNAGEPVTINALANDSDPDGDPILVESVASQPGNGTVELQESDTLVYVPDDAFSGTDEFRYWLVDAGGLRVQGDVLVGVMPAPAENRPPNAVADEVTVGAGESTVPIDVLANDSDPDGDQLTVVDVTDAGQGTVTVAEGGAGLAYTPPDGIEGDRTSVGFVYTIDDGAGHAVDASVNVDVLAEPEPQPPVAIDDVVGPVAPDQTVTVDVLANDIDPDGDPAELDVATDADDVTVRGGSVRVPVTGSTRTIVYSVTDPDGLSASASVTVNVQSNRPPDVVPFESEIEHDTPTTLDLTDQASDPDGDDLSFVYNRDARGGTVAVDSDDASTFVVTFTPEPGYSGQAGFSYSVQDGNDHEVAASANLTVLPPDNRPPTVSDRELEAEVGRSTTLDLQGLVEDPDTDDTHTFEVGDVTGPMDVALSEARATITPEVTATGATGSFAVTATDAAGEAASGTVTVTIKPSTLPPPTANDDMARTTQGEPVTVDVLSNDVGSGLAIASVDGGADGVAEVTDEHVVFTPDPDFFGTATATYVVEDEQETADRQASGTIEVEVIGFPDSPATPQVTVASREATLTWTSPARNGAPITNYRIEHDQGGQREVEATSLTWGDLENGTEYRFRVQAFNEAGWGDWSPWSPAEVPDERPGRPAAPTIDWDDGQLDVAWQTPPNQGTPVTQYELQIGGAASETRVVEAQPNPSYEWAGLDNGSNYQFRVRAENDEDWSPWSPWSATEHPNTTPDAPAKPTVSNGPNYLDVQWTKPYDGGDTITHYEIRLQGSGTSEVRTASGESTSNFRWTGLGGQQGELFTFEVRAVNRATQTAAGWSPASDPAKACGVPAAPVKPTVERGDQQATVSWQAPDDAGCDITGYQIGLVGGGVVATAGAGERSTSVTGLTNGTEYRFRVRALNTELDDQGPGAWSANSDVVVPAGRPFAPPNFTSTATDEGELTVSWNPANGNGDPVQDYIVAVNGVDQSPTTTTSMVFTGLSGGTTYNFTVRARNSVGEGATSSTSDTAETRPSKVARPSVNNNTRGQLTWSWSKPSANGNSINHYRLDRSNGASTLTRTSRSYTWSGLGDDTTRSVRVRACNDWGCGAWSDSRSGTTKPPPPSLTVVRSVDDPDRGGTYQNPIVDMRNFASNRTYDFMCDSEGPFNTDKDDNYLTTNGSGNRLDIHSRCYAGSGASVTMKIVPDGGGSVIAQVTYTN